MSRTCLLNNDFDVVVVVVVVVVSYLGEKKEEKRCLTWRSFTYWLLLARHCEQLFHGNAYFNWCRHYFLNLQHAGDLIDMWSKTENITSNLGQSRLVRNISQELSNERSSKDVVFCLIFASE